MLLVKPYKPLLDKLKVISKSKTILGICQEWILDGKDFKESGDFCICGHAIIQRYFLINKYSKQKIIVGSCCVQSFTEENKEIIKNIKTYKLKPSSKAEKIRYLALELLEKDITDWTYIRKSILANKELNASSKEIKRVEQKLLSEGIIAYTYNG